MQKNIVLAKLKPFKAIRPTRDKAYLVPTRPYYTYKSNILKAKLSSNPFTFLHVINPEFNEKKKTKTNSDQRFELVRNKFEEFIEKGIFIQDEMPAYYLYRQTQDDHVYRGIIAGASVEEYNNDKIKKHEATLTEREETFTKYLEIVSFNAEPVLLFHKKSLELTAFFEGIMTERPEYEFSTTQGIKHELWVVNQPAAIDKIDEFYENIDTLYIADGHHRSASSARYHNEGLDKNNSGAYFLSFLMTEDDLNIFEYNRLVKDLNGLSSKEFISLLKDDFDIAQSEEPIKPDHAGVFSMYLKEKWYRLQIKNTELLSGDPVQTLDAYLLNKLILEPILKIGDLKTDKRIDFVEGTKGFKGIKKQIDSGKFKIGFMLYPIKPDQIRAVAEAGLTMPPKSTWIEPKLRSGLTIYPLK